jgi:hypothetical protein
VVEHLPSKCEVLSSNPNTRKTKEKRKIAPKYRFTRYKMELNNIVDGFVTMNLKCRSKEEFL